MLRRFGVCPSSGTAGADAYGPPINSKVTKTRRKLLCPRRAHSKPTLDTQWGFFYFDRARTAPGLAAPMRPTPLPSNI